MQVSENQCSLTSLAAGFITIFHPLFTVKEFDIDQLMSRGISGLWPIFLDNQVYFIKISGEIVHLTICIFTI